MVNKFIRFDALLRSATSSSRPLLSSSLISLRYSTVPTIIFVEHSFLLSGICIERFEVLLGYVMVVCLCCSSLQWLNKATGELMVVNCLTQTLQKTSPYANQSLHLAKNKWGLIVWSQSKPFQQKFSLHFEKQSLTFNKRKSCSIFFFRGG